MFFGTPLCRGRWACYEALHRAHQTRMERHMMALGVDGKDRPFFDQKMLMRVEALWRLNLLETRSDEADERAKVAPWWSAPYWRARRDAFRMIAWRIRKTLEGDDATRK